MKLISHRGNLTGPQPHLENTQEQILYAISQGFDVEIDVWYIDGSLFLGHDGPEHPIAPEFLERDELWCHAKNLGALQYLLNNNIHCFWHEGDQRTLTSRGYIWTYPGKDTVAESVIVELTSTLPTITEQITGVCGDYVANWRKEDSVMLLGATKNMA
jgi:hypothetical protein